MAEEGGESQLVAELPESAVAWLDEQAAAHEVTREEFLRRLVSVLRAIDGDSPDPVGENLETLAERVAALEDDVETKVEDVRERVVQLKRETDGKAPADHDHPRLAEEVDAATEAAAAARSDVEDVESAVGDLRETTERGFENYERILEYLTDTTDDFEGKLTRVAAALVATRRSVDGISAGEAERRAVAEIKTAANRHGIAAADCEHCGGDVDIGLLAEPACPHCGTPVRDVEPASGFFGSPTLLEGDPSTPVTESGVAVDDAADAEAVAEALLGGDPASETGDETEADDSEEDPRTATDGNGIGTETGFVFIGDHDER